MVEPIRVVVKHLPFGAAAMTLYPRILLKPSVADNPCTWSHEMVHFEDIERTGVIRWYTEYLIEWAWMALKYWSRLKAIPIRLHSKEVPAYAVSDKCQEEQYA